MKNAIPPAKHLGEKSFAADKGDRCIGLVLVAIQLGEDLGGCEAGILA